MSENVIVLFNILLHINRATFFVKFLPKLLKLFFDLKQVKYTSFLFWALLCDSQKIVWYINSDLRGKSPSQVKSKSWLWLFSKFQKSQSHDFDLTLTWLFSFFLYLMVPKAMNPKSDSYPIFLKFWVPM